MGACGPQGGPRGRAPQGKKRGQTLNKFLLQDAEAVESRYVAMHVDTFIYEEYNVFMAKARIAPLGP